MGNQINSLTDAVHEGLGLNYPPVIDLGPQLTREQLLHSMQATMKLHQGGPVWLFAYGSLIWRPECTAVERQRGRIHGYHRGCTSGPTNTGAHRNFAAWCSASTVAAPAAGLPIVCRMSACKSHCWRSGSARCLIRPTGHTGSAVVWKTAAGFRPWVSSWNVTCPAMRVICRTAYSPRCLPAPVDAMAPPATTSNRPQPPCAPTPCRI